MDAHQIHVKAQPGYQEKNQQSVKIKIKHQSLFLSQKLKNANWEKRIIKSEITSLSAKLKHSGSMRFTATSRSSNLPL